MRLGLGVAIPDIPHSILDPPWTEGGPRANRYVAVVAAAVVAAMVVVQWCGGALLTLKRARKRSSNICGGGGGGWGGGWRWVGWVPHANPHVDGTMRVARCAQCFVGSEPEKRATANTHYTITSHAESE